MRFRIAPSRRRAYWRLVACLLLLGPGPSTSYAANDWSATASLPAKEAHQAAAADERYLYAIENRKIVKYDRFTGDRLGESVGSAEHLNSGFFHEGRLYCAHSNFPLFPERSILKVLDPNVMRLSDFKDFGDFGGSLTWAVRRDGHWWCCFARYGDDNAKTFFVEFDENWRELGRWTFPPEMIRELGKNSVSGGLWRGDDLLTTGHDDKTLFRLRLPATGTVLELLERQKIPFTGQGIAADPLSGGLVGIDRREKRLLVAVPDAAPLRLRVLTYNIRHAVGSDNRLDLDRIARVIRGVGPDLVAVQELDQKTRRAGNVDQPAELARRTGLTFAFGPNLDFDGGKYGHGVLSRFPILRHENAKLPNFDKGEQRSLLTAEIELPGGRPPLPFWATHFDHRPPPAERLASVRTIAERLRPLGERPVLLAGDFNAEPASETVRALLLDWRLADAGLPTSPADKPKQAIDHILFRPAGRWKILESRVLDEAVASDHRPLLTVLELSPEAGK